MDKKKWLMTAGAGALILGMTATIYGLNTSLNRSELERPNEYNNRIAIAETVLKDTGLDDRFTADEVQEIFVNWGDVAGERKMCIRDSYRRGKSGLPQGQKRQKLHHAKKCGYDGLPPCHRAGSGVWVSLFGGTNGAADGAVSGRITEKEILNMKGSLMQKHIKGPFL